MRAIMDTNAMRAIMDTAAMQALRDRLAGKGKIVASIVVAFWAVMVIVALILVFHHGGSRGLGIATHCDQARRIASGRPHQPREVRRSSSSIAPSTLHIAVTCRNSPSMDRSS